MKLDVPFFKQETSVDCGPVALKMVLVYFGERACKKALGEEMQVKEGKGIYTIQIGVVAREHGFKVDSYSKEEDNYEKHHELEYYKQYSALSKKELNEWVEKAKDAGVNVIEKSLTLQEVLELVTEDSIPIILLDWNIVKETPEKGYQGHFVPIVGYDNEHVYIHNPGLAGTKEFMPIKKEIFDKARKAKGTDEDIVVIHRK